MWTDWSEMLVSKLRELRNRGLSAREIGACLGVTKNSVIGKLNRIGESVPKSPAQRSHDAKRAGKEAARKLRAERKFKPAKTPPPVKTVPPRKRNIILPPARAVGVDALLALQVEDCRWPIGNPRNVDFRFCGAQRGNGSMYCDHHYVVSIKPENGDGENGA